MGWGLVLFQLSNIKPRLGAAAIYMPSADPSIKYSIYQLCNLFPENQRAEPNISYKMQRPYAPECEFLIFDASPALTAAI